MRTFKFIPSQIIAAVDQDITIHFVGNSRSSHRIKVELESKKKLDIRRGEIETITLHLTENGCDQFSLVRLPTLNEWTSHRNCQVRPRC